MSAGSDDAEKEKVILPIHYYHRMALYQEKRLTLAEQAWMEQWWGSQREAWL